VADELPAGAERIDLDAEHERILSEIDTLTDQLAEMDTDTEQYATLDSRSSRLDTHRRATEWVRDNWDVDEVVIRSLSFGDDARLDENTQSEAERRLWQIAIGTVEAPYLEHDGHAYPEVSMDAVEETVATIDSPVVPIAVGRWLQDRIDEVSTVGNLAGDGSYATSLAAKRAATSTET